MPVASPVSARDVPSRGGRSRAGVLALLPGAALAILAASPQAWAARCDEQNDPITVSETQQMDYGTIAAASAGGTVTISPTGTITVPGGYTANGVTAPGTFQVLGKQGCAVSLSFCGRLANRPWHGDADRQLHDQRGLQPDPQPGSRVSRGAQFFRWR